MFILSYVSTQSNSLLDIGEKKKIPIHGKHFLSINGTGLIHKVNIRQEVIQNLSPLVLHLIEESPEH